ncbi:MAG: Verru_Chthon cassette protein B [Verrucomicrobium sp.]|nr:Verru_Chthon cassette protein B [Verrucomicrobium sp.]
MNTTPIHRAAPFKKSAPAAGFSLPEVAIAVAIAAMGMLTLLGLIPAGLENLRQAGDSISSSRICQQMIGELQSADWGVKTGSGVGWSKLADYHNAVRYFDGEGTRINTSAPGTLSTDNSRNVSYVAKFEVVDAGISPTLPGGVSMVRADSRKVILHVAVSPQADFDFSKANSKHEKVAFTVTRQF